MSRKPDKRFILKSIPPAFRLTSDPGQVPTKRRMRTLGQVQALSKMGARSSEGAASLSLGKLAGRPQRMTQGRDPFTMPGDRTEARLLAQVEPMLTGGSVVRGMGLHAGEAASWTRFLDKAVRNSPNEVVYRKAVMEKLLDSGMEGGARRAIFGRAMDHWRTVQKSKGQQVELVSPEDLLQKDRSHKGGLRGPSEEIQKAMYIGPRGGKWADPQHTIPWDPEKHGKARITVVDKTGEGGLEAEATPEKQVFTIPAKSEPGWERMPVGEFMPGMLKPGQTVKVAWGRPIKGLSGGAWPWVMLPNGMFQDAREGVKEPDRRKLTPEQFLDFIGRAEASEVEVSEADAPHGVATTPEQRAIVVNNALSDPAFQQVKATVSDDKVNLVVDLNAEVRSQKDAVTLLDAAKARLAELVAEGKLPDVSLLEQRHRGKRQWGKYLQVTASRRDLVALTAQVDMVAVEPIGQADYEERQEAKRENLEARAARARGKVAAARQREEQIAGGIPMGQPILVGHHSEKRHRRDVERIHRAAQIQVEEGKKAERLAARAEGLGTHGISSDDPEAVVKLVEKLSSMEAQRDAMKARNKQARKAGKPKPHESWEFSNLSGNIRRVKLRIEELRDEARARAEQAATGGPPERSGTAPDGTTYEIEEDLDDNRLRIFFGGKPSAEVRQQVKAYGFRWDRYNKCWSRKLNASARSMADQLHDKWNPPEKPVGPMVEPETTPIEQPPAQPEEEDDPFEPYIRARREAKERVQKTIAVGQEYSNGRGDQFGAVLREISGELPFRVQWYDKRGLSGHSEVSSLEAAVELLVSDLGDDIQEAPGSMDQWAIVTPSRVLPTEAGWDRMPASNLDIDALEPGDRLAVKYKTGPVVQFEVQPDGRYRDVNDPERDLLEPRHIQTILDDWGTEVAVKDAPEAPARTPVPKQEVAKPKKGKKMKTDQLELFRSGAKVDVVTPDVLQKALPVILAGAAGAGGLFLGPRGGRYLDPQHKRSADAYFRAQDTSKALKAQIKVLAKTAKQALKAEGNPKALGDAVHELIDLQKQQAGKMRVLGRDRAARKLDARADKLRTAMWSIRSESFGQGREMPPEKWKAVKKAMRGLLKSMVDAQLDLVKAEARGGKYHRRIPRAGGKGFRYIYSPEDYNNRSDAHTGGEDNAKAYLGSSIAKCLKSAGGSCGPDAFKSLVKRYGAKQVAEALRDGQKSGTLAFKKGKFSLVKPKG